MITDKPVLFVHVPKTAGTSVHRVLTETPSWKITPESRRFYSRMKHNNHIPVFVIERYNILNNFFVFSIVRNPFTRAFSYYQHYKRLQLLDISFEQFLDHVRRKKQAVFEFLDHVSIKKNTNTTPFIVYSQSFFLFDMNGKMSLDKLYRFEHIEEFETDFNIKMPNLNVGNYSLDEYLNSYTSTTIDLVRHIYLEDFVNLNYSTDFQQEVVL